MIFAILVVSIDTGLHHHDLILSLNGSSQSNSVSVQQFKNWKNSCHYVTILTYNINSFNANSHNLLLLFNNFVKFPDILVMTETWFKNDNTEDFDGFHANHTCRLGRRSGGCSIYVKDCWNSVPIDDSCISNESIEMLKRFPVTFLRNVLSWFLRVRDESILTPRLRTFSDICICVLSNVMQERFS